jgi:hypothetical protein
VYFVYTLSTPYIFIPIEKSPDIHSPVLLRFRHLWRKTIVIKRFACTPQV